MPPKSKPTSAQPSHHGKQQNNNNNNNNTNKQSGTFPRRPTSEQTSPPQPGTTSLNLVSHPHVYINNNVSTNNPSLPSYEYAPVEGGLKPHAFRDSVSHGPDSACYLQLRHYMQQHILTKKDKELQIGIERIFYGQHQRAAATSGSFFSGAGTGSSGATATGSNNMTNFSPLALDRKNPACLNLLISKVTTEWSKPGAVNTKVLRAQPSLLRDVVTVLESIIYLIYDDSLLPNLQIHPPMREVARQSVAGLTAFCSRSCLFGFASAMEKKPICVSTSSTHYYFMNQHQNQKQNDDDANAEQHQHQQQQEEMLLTDFTSSSTCSSFAQSNVPTSTHSSYKNLNKLLYPEKTTTSSVAVAENGESPGKQTNSSTSSSSDVSQPPIIVATLSPKNDNNNPILLVEPQSSSTTTERLEVDLRAASLYLISILVKISPDSMFSMWTTLFPDGDPILVKTQSAGTLLSSSSKNNEKEPKTEGAIFLDSFLSKTTTNNNNNSKLRTSKNNNKPASDSALLPSLNHRCTILSPLLGDDVRVRCAAIYALVAIIAAVSNTLAVVPLEIIMNSSSNIATASSSSTTGARRATSPVARNPNSTSSNISQINNNNNNRIDPNLPQQHQSDISRLGSVLLQVFRALIAALNFQEINIAKTRREICELIPQYMQAVREQQKHHQVITTNNSNNNKKNNEGKDDNDNGNDDDDDEEEQTNTASHHDLANNKRKLYKLLISAKAFDHHMSAIVHTLLLHAVGALSVVVPLQRTPSISRLLFAYMETNFAQTFVSPMTVGQWQAKKDGGYTLDHEVTATAFFLTALHNSTGARLLVRNFYRTTKAGPIIFEAMLECLPHIDVWKFSSAVARNHPDVFRKYLWQYFFPEAKNLFSPGTAYAVIPAASSSTGTATTTNSNNNNNANNNTHTKRLRPVHIPYQAHLESLRCFIYFLGVRALPWERIQLQHQPLFHHYSLVPPNAYPSSTQIDFASNNNSNNNNNNSNNLFVFIEEEKKKSEAAMTNNNININNNNNATNNTVKVSSLAKHQQQQSQMAAFLSGGLLISAIPAFLHGSRQTRNKNVGEGVATNVAPLDLHSNQIVAADQRATTAEIVRIVKEIALPAMKSGIENVRCVATRIIAAIRNSFYTDCLSAASTLFTKQEIETLIVKTILDKCKGDVDEARLEALTTAYCFVAVTPALAQIANKKVSSVVCDELIARKGLLSGEGRTRACQIVEALSSRILKYINDEEEEEIANECSRIIRACVNILQSTTLTPTALATTSSGRVFDEVVTQVASIMRAISFAVSTLPVDYLFMEVGSRGDDAVSWAFAEIFNQVEKVCVKDSKLFKALYENDENNNSVVEINDTQTTILCAAFEALARLCCVNPDVADCDQQSVRRTIEVLLPNAIALFPTSLDLAVMSRNLYFVSGNAIRAVASILNLLEILEDDAADERKRHVMKSLFADKMVVKRILKNTIKSLYVALNDADVTRKGLREDFVECCEHVLRLVMKHFVDVNNQDWIIFHDDDEQQQELVDDDVWKYHDLLQERFSSSIKSLFSLRKSNKQDETELSITTTSSNPNTTSTASTSRPQSNSPSKSRDRAKNSNNNDDEDDNDQQQQPQAQQQQHVYVPNPKWTDEENEYQEQRFKAKAQTSFVAQYD